MLWVALALAAGGMLWLAVALGGGDMLWVAEEKVQQLEEIVVHTTLLPGAPTTAFIRVATP